MDGKEEDLPRCTLQDFQDPIEPLYFTLAYSSLALITTSLLLRNKLRSNEAPHQRSKYWLGALLLGVSGIVLCISGGALGIWLRPICPGYCTCDAIIEIPYSYLGYVVIATGIVSIFDALRFFLRGAKTLVTPERAAALAALWSSLRHIVKECVGRVWSLVRPLVSQYYHKHYNQDLPLTTCFGMRNQLGDRLCWTWVTTTVTKLDSYCYGRQTPFVWAWRLVRATLKLWSNKGSKRADDESARND